MKTIHIAARDNGLTGLVSRVGLTVSLTAVLFSGYLRIKIHISTCIQEERRISTFMENVPGLPRAVCICCESFRQEAIRIKREKLQETGADT